MLQLNINEVKKHLSATLAKVANGETVIICKRNKPVAEIRPIKKPLQKKRPLGLMRKKYPGFKVPDNINEPLPDDILADFSGEKR